jgi:hypothetical protein
MYLSDYSGCCRAVCCDDIHIDICKTEDACKTYEHFFASEETCGACEV